MKNIIIDWRNLRRQDNETFYTFERFFKAEIFQVFELADKLSGNNIKGSTNPHKHRIFRSPILDLIAK